MLGDLQEYLVVEEASYLRPKTQKTTPIEPTSADNQRDGEKMIDMTITHKSNP